MGSTVITVLTGSIITLFGIGLVCYCFRMTWQQICRTPNRRRLFVAVASAVIIGIVCLIPPPKLLPPLELDELDHDTGVLLCREEVQENGTKKILYLEGDSNEYDFSLCEFYSMHVRNQLLGKEVTLWHLDHKVYQASTPESSIYPLSATHRHLLWKNANNLWYYIGRLCNFISGMLIFFFLKRKRENDSLDEVTILQEKDDEFSSSTWLKNLLLLLCIAGLGAFAFLSNTYASHLRLAKLASYEHIVCPSNWAGSYKDMMEQLEQSMSLASTDEERKEVARVWKRELYKVLFRFYEKELPNCYNRKAYSTGEKACAKLAQYIEASRDAYLLTNSEKRYSEDLACFIAWQSSYLSDLENWQKCEDLIAQAISYDPSLSYSYSVRAYAIWKQNRPAEALESINKAIELDPKDAYSYELRSSIHKALGNKKAAKEDEKKRKELEAKTQNRKRDS